MWTNVGTIITEAQHIQGSTASGRRCQTRYISWPLVAVEGMEQPAIQHRFEHAPQTVQLQGVSRNELDFDPSSGESAF